MRVSIRVVSHLERARHMLRTTPGIVWALQRHATGGPRPTWKGVPTAGRIAVLRPPVACPGGPDRPKRVTLGEFDAGHSLFRRRHAAHAFARPSAERATDGCRTGRSPAPAS